MSLVLPRGEKKILLHTCCAPCSCSIIDTLLSEAIEPTLFFYNPNIQPVEEYERRKKEVIRYAHKREIVFVDADYDPQRWLQHVQGHEKDAERGARCSLCFEMRLQKTAEYASKNGFTVISSALAFSRWKNFDQVTQAGRKAEEVIKDVIYFAYNWRKGHAVLRSKEIAEQEKFYRQKYCGCMFSCAVSF